MKHIFIVNPAAGKENACPRISREIAALGTDAEIYITKKPNDATDFIKQYCYAHKEPVRFYACGGDGTLNEVVNGVYGFDFASVGCVPSGSGDDFIKYYGGKSCFESIENLINGQEEWIDLMDVNGRLAINATHFGFDSVVAKTMSTVRRKKLIGGKNAYSTGVIVGLIKGMSNRCSVKADGELLNPNEKILLCTVANGQYVGGSFRCAPRSLNNDGLLEVCLFKPVSHITFLRLMPDYQKGTHLDGKKPLYQKIMTYRRAKEIEISAPDGFVYSLDGELIKSEHFTVKVIPKAIRFVVPVGATAIPGDLHTARLEK